MSNTPQMIPWWSIRGAETSLTSQAGKAIVFVLIYPVSFRNRRRRLTASASTRGDGVRRIAWLVERVKAKENHIDEV
jgi:hypothetical protein